jgi:uncharacterized membrane protein YfcA
VIQFPDLSLFTAAALDGRFPLALAIVAIAGLVRGFSGFGSALIHLPLMAALYDPRIAAVTILLIDTTAAALLSGREFSRCEWREIAPIFIAAATALPFGAMALVLIDAVTLRWFITALIFVFLVPLAMGWRYHGKPTPPITLGVGALSGLGAGAVQIAAPPVLLYWLGATKHVTTVRANFMVYLLLTNLFGVVVYAVKGLLTADVIALSVLLAIPFFLAMLGGARYFHGSSDTTYRRIAYAIIGVAALLSMPLFDALR